MLRCTSFIKPSKVKSSDKWRTKFSYDVIFEIDYKGHTIEHKVAFELQKHEAVQLQRTLNHIGHLIWQFVNGVENAQEH